MTIGAERLEDVLAAISASTNSEQLREAAGMARRLRTEHDKGIARWAYDYHRHHHDRVAA